MGNKLIYLESGSGSAQSIHPDLIREVCRNITVPLIAGGGIKTPEQAQAISKAGAEIIVVGNAIENNLGVLTSLVKSIQQQITIKRSSILSPIDTLSFIWRDILTPLWAEIPIFPTYFSYTKFDAELDSR